MSSQIYYCPYCDCKYTRKTRRDNHIKNKHPKKVSDYFEYKCGECNKYFGSQRSLKVHTGQEHMKKGWCKICKKKFCNNGSAWMHFDRVHADKKFKCDEPGCIHAYGADWLLKNHKDTFHIERKFECPDELCDKIFKQQRHVDKHYKEVHGPQSQEYEYRICSLCDISFRTKVLSGSLKCRKCCQAKFTRCEYQDENGNQCQTINVKRYFWTCDGKVCCATKRAVSEAQRLCDIHAPKQFGNDVYLFIKRQQLLRQKSVTNKLKPWLNHLGVDFTFGEALKYRFYSKALVSSSGKYSIRPPFPDIALLPSNATFINDRTIIIELNEDNNHESYNKEEEKKR
eukprot:162842_1